MSSTFMPTRASTRFACALALAALTFSFAPIPTPICTTTVIKQDNGGIETWSILCGGTCDGQGVCIETSAGSVSWCQCDQGPAGFEPCVTVLVGESMARCVNLECGTPCQMQEAQMPGGKPGTSTTDYWCTCG